MFRYRYRIENPKGYLILGIYFIIMGAVIILSFFWILPSVSLTFDVFILALAIGGFWIILGIILIVKREFFAIHS